MASGLVFTLLLWLSCGLVAEAMMKWPSFLKGFGCRCPKGWTEMNKRCFLYVSAHQQWSYAELDCIKYGGNLASYHSKGEYDSIRDFVRVESGSDTSIWVGGSDAASNGVWLWSDGSAFSYSNWGSGQPNSVKNKNCMEINYKGHDYVSNMKCSVRQPYVCARNLQVCFSCP